MCENKFCVTCRTIRQNKNKFRHFIMWIQSLFRDTSRWRKREKKIKWRNTLSLWLIRPFAVDFFFFSFFLFLGELFSILKCSFTMHYTSSLRKAECFKFLALFSLFPNSLMKSVHQTKHIAIKLLFIFVFVSFHHTHPISATLHSSTFFSFSFYSSLSLSFELVFRCCCFSFVSKSHLCFIYETIHQNSIRE